MGKIGLRTVKICEMALGKYESCDWGTEGVEAGDITDLIIMIGVEDRRAL